MAKTDIIGTQGSAQPRRRCAHCEESFDGPEFRQFMFQKSSRELECMRCDRMNYFVNREDYNRASYAGLIALFLISLVPLLAGLVWLIGFYAGYFDVLWLWAPIGAALLTAGMIRISLKLFVWQLYHVQADSFELQMEI